MGDMSSYTLLMLLHVTLACSQWFQEKGEEGLKKEASSVTGHADLQNDRINYGRMDAWRMFKEL